MIIEHKVIDLPYGYGDLSPYISEETMRFHHDKHYKKYADELNKLLKEEPSLQELDMENLLKELSSMSSSSKNVKIRNNAGGYYNHTIWWPMLSPKSNSKPSGLMENHIKSNFGSYDSLIDQFSSSALSHFGSGWCWLTIRGSNMEICCTDNQDNPILTKQGFPVLGIDIWEHAYYIDYRNRRKDYIQAFWKMVNWKEVENRFLQAEAWNTNQTI
jgi:Fe-Mn family superoxide dismutase